MCVCVFLQLDGNLDVYVPSSTVGIEWMYLPTTEIIVISYPSLPLELSFSFRTGKEST